MLDVAIEILRIYRRLTEKYQTYSDEYCRLTTVGSIKGNEAITQLVELKGKSRDYYLLILAIYIYARKAKKGK